MKRIFLALIVLGLATGMQSCNNGDYKASPQGNLPTPPSGNNGGGNSAGIMTAKVNGNSFSATSGTVTNPVAGKFIIQGMNGGSAIQLQLADLNTGDHTIDVINTLGAYAAASGGFAGTSGKVTINSNDATKVTGTFSFSDGGSNNVTDGNFSVNK